MSNDNIEHFENIWEQAEIESNKIYANKSIPDILQTIEEKLGNLKQLYFTQLPEEQKKFNKQRMIGEILFVLSTISSIENVNVWEVMKWQIEWTKNSQISSILTSVSNLEGFSLNDPR